MNLLMNLVVALQIVSALVMIGLVLIQHGKGADMGASFGSGSSGSLFGATGSANFLSRSTAVCASVFFICTLALAYTSNERQPSSGGSVLDRPAANAPVIPVTGADQVPGAASGVPIVPTTTAPVPVPGATPAASGAAAIPAK